MIGAALVRPFDTSDWLPPSLATALAWLTVGAASAISCAYFWLVAVRHTRAG
jgi:hypothetical protein